ncbi:FtsW/RodA/SpoVE family cell cycle protein [Neobacillus jeddahensis]|uniref:FtsW/RodA/SpoVE family cell cycle protein n=1 Tax=Neobacillus jeddahensis TaxID=1461580 RepID=UPI00058C08D8|nr:FtsW/RodA/SpoVE family cell cycle protein [Neobacillus jeddahensis]
METKKQGFLNEVSNQIHSNEAKKFVTDELSYHLTETKKMWMEKGLTAEEAEEQAVDQMGSAIILGRQLNKLHRPKVDWLLVGLLLMTLILGFLPMYSLGYMNVGHFIFNKIMFVLIATVAAGGLMLIDYRKWFKQGWLFYSIGLFILLLLKYFSNTMINGLPLFRIPPLITIESLMAVPFLFLAWSVFFDNERMRVWQFVLLFLIPFGLLLSLPSISTTYLYTGMVLVMLWGSKFRKKTILTIWTGAVSCFLVFILTSWFFLKEYQTARLFAFLKPEKYSDGAGYMILRIKELLSKAGWFGASKNDFIPEAHTNFVFVSFTYYYGWIFAVILVLILTLFVARIVAISVKIKDSFGKLLLIGAVALYGIQLVTNIAMVLGIVPMITMSLPFISYGLMPTLFNAFLIGIVLSVYRRKDLIPGHNL